MFEDPILDMPILTIIWQGHFSRARHLRPFVVRRIIRHYDLRGLAMVEPEIRYAVIRYVLVLDV